MEYLVLFEMKVIKIVVINFSEKVEVQQVLKIAARQGMADNTSFSLNFTPPPSPTELVQ